LTRGDRRKTRRRGTRPSGDPILIKLISDPSTSPITERVFHQELDDQKPELKHYGRPRPRNLPDQRENFVLEPFSLERFHAPLFFMDRRIADTIAEDPFFFFFPFLTNCLVVILETQDAFLYPLSPVSGSLGNFLLVNVHRTRF